MADVEHGTRSGYEHGCRCSDCTEARRQYNAEKASERALRISYIPHGTMKGYQGWACRCCKCREAHNAYRQERLAQLSPDKHGTQTGYSYGCRCSRCKTANTLASRRRASKPTSSA